MTTKVTSRQLLAGAVLAASLMARPSDVVAAAVLRSADIRIVVTSPTSCEVTMALTIDGGSEIDHRIEAFEGSRIDLIAIGDAHQVRDASTIGRTRSLVLRPDQSAYHLHYRVQQPETRASRCPLWLPAVPTDGQSRAVRLRVELPAAASAARSMPAFIWTGSHGTTTLGNLPAFVRVSYAGDGDAPAWDVQQAMDLVAIAVFVVASAIWVWRGRR